MIDYAGLRALREIIEEQSFERAAKKLHISQSAVSQRLANLEAYHGQKLLIRELPYRPSELGTHLLAHMQQVDSLEAELLARLDDEAEAPILRLATNRDSLDMWLCDILKDEGLRDTLQLHLMTSDQDHTLTFLQQGQADLAISSREKALSGGESTYLGSMKYILVCTPQFKRRYLPGRITKSEISKAPAIIFDRLDQTLGSFLKRHHNYEAPFPQSFFPSTTAFKEAILTGHGYGLLSTLDIANELQSGALVMLNRRKQLKVPLYLHSWQIKSKAAKDLEAAIVAAALRNLDS